ncbi:MAG: c-type cytochrome [Myxococcales bacterium]|nr:c-type cytochrome [Myxococcales bacterium]
MSGEKQPNVDRVVHSYDGIEEYDNDLPRWWLLCLYATMVFALGYYFVYDVFHAAPTTQEAYHAEMQSVYAAEAARIRAMGAVTPEALLALSRDDATVRRGREVFVSTCAACHQANGGGNIGPNLTDTAWINGGAPTDILRVVTSGVVARGMPAWGPQLGTERVTAAVAYVLTLRNTNVAGGKAPQGTVSP